MKFLVDSPLGGLAKWLRFCGFDAALLRLSAAPRDWPPPAAGTYILTPREGAARASRPDVLILETPDTPSQLVEVFQRLKIGASQLKPLNRCAHCNQPLATLDRDQVQGRVPEHVFHYFRRFYECPGCHRVYWPGSHLTQLVRTLKEIWPEVEIGQEADAQQERGRES